jgi:HAD superfamily hydrolase (TIGR01509 family)
VDDVDETGTGAPLLPGPFAAVVLDLDGLLVQTEEVWSRAKEILFERHGFRFERADHLAVFGTSEQHTSLYFTRRFGLDESHSDALREEYMAIAGSLLRGELPVTDGARELVAWLRGRVPLGLASNTRRKLVGQILEGVRLTEAFDVVVTGDDGAAKPDPDLYLIACRRLGVDPGSAVALEDSPTGVRAARAAGLVCIGVPSTPEVTLAEAHHVVRSLRDVTPARGKSAAEANERTLPTPATSPG